MRGRYDLKESGLTYDEIGIESGQLSISLCKGLIAQGLPVKCVDARHMAAALSARINKNASMRTVNKKIFSFP